MAEYHKGILGIEYQELTNGIISSFSYDKLVQRRKINVIRRGCKGTPALVAYDSLPEDIKRAYVEKHGDPKAGLRHDTFLAHIEYDQAAYETYSSYVLADGRNLKPAVVDLYCNNAKAIKAIISLRNDRIALRKALGGSTKNIWAGIADVVTELKGQLKHDLPENPRSLERKVKEFQEFGYEILISGKFSNNNRSKVKDEQQEATLRQLFRKHNNLDNETVRSLYNTIADAVGWDRMTATTVGNYRQKWNLETIAGRRGEGFFDDNVAMQVRRKAPVLPLVYWTMDGWDAELFYQKTEINKKGESVTTYHNRLTIVIILDPCGKYPVGYAIGTHETPELIREAMRNAIKHTEELFGKKHKVLQLQSDNYSKKTLRPFYEALTESYTPARVKNAKSKVIEPYFNFINKKYCQLMPNWSGFGVKARKKSQPNEDFLNKIRHSFPDAEGCRKQLEGIIQLERIAKMESYKLAYNHLPNDDKVFMNELEYYRSLCETKAKTTQLQSNGFVFQINNEKYEYECFDKNFRRYSHIDWVVKYDPSNMDKVLATDGKGELNFMLEQAYVQPMALYDRQEGDANELKRIKGFNADVKEEILESMEKDHGVVMDLFSRPELEGTLAKFVLCDSNGQHKNRKNEARLKGAKMVEIEQNREEMEESRNFTQMREQYVRGKINIEEYINQ